MLIKKMDLIGISENVYVLNSMKGPARLAKGAV